MRLRILGPVDIHDEHTDRRMTPNGVKQRALLATLVVRTGQTISIDRLVEELWGTDRPANATNALQAHVARLRRLLSTAGSDPDQIVTHPPGYSFAPGPLETDVAEFNWLSTAGRELVGRAPLQAIERCRAALALWRGAAFDGCVSGPILSTEAENLDENRLATLEALYEANLRDGRHADVVGELREISAAYPLRERFYDQLIVALYRCGRQSEALGVYDRIRRTLVHELGVEPGPALRERVQAVLAHSPELLTDAGTTVGRGQPDPDRTAASDAHGGLAHEVAQLRSRMDSLVRQQEALTRMVQRMLAPSRS